jgi:putative ABC transport system substrate-binding protein
LSQDQLERWEEEIEAEGKALGLQVQSVRVHRNDMETTFSEISRNTQGLSVTAAGGASVQNRARIVEFAMNRRLPAIYDRSRFVKAGGLMSYGTDSLDLYRQAATYVAKILKGARPADLPVERPKKFELVINLNTANHLGITIPPSLLLQADKVIK